MPADRNPVFANGRGDKIIELKCEYCSAASRCQAFDPLSIGAPFEVFVPRLLSRIIQPGDIIRLRIQRGYLRGF